MKKFLLLLLFQCLIAFSQEYKFPEIAFHTIQKQTSEYYKLLGIKDTTALLVSCGNIGSFTGINSKIIVYYNDGSVKKFTLIQTGDKFKKRKIRLSDTKPYHLFLNNLVTDNNLTINREKLVDDMKTGFVVLDGSIDFFAVYQNNKELSFFSHASEIYIKEKVSGWEERQKLVDLTATFKTVFKEE